MLSGVLYAFEFAIDVKREGDAPIERVQFFAERCSGSNYMEALIQKNCFLKEEYCYGWKHFPAWVDMRPENSDKKDFSDFNTLAHNENCLFIVVFRNPYDWIRSFHQQPHHSKGSLRTINFRKFIRSTWRLDEKDPTVKREKEKNPLVDKDPRTGVDFKNVMKLRSAKIETMLNIKKHVHNIYYVRYESVKEHPQEVLREISEIFNIKTKKDFVDVKEYKGKNKEGIYIPKKYQSIFITDLFYINSQLDLKLEKRIGYDIKRFQIDSRI